MALDISLGNCQLIIVRCESRIVPHCSSHTRLGRFAACFHRHVAGIPQVLSNLPVIYYTYYSTLILLWSDSAISMIAYFARPGINRRAFSQSQFNSSSEVTSSLVYTRCLYYFQGLFASTQTNKYGSDNHRRDVRCTLCRRITTESLYPDSSTASPYI
jgi:hypothetical protein